MDKKVKIVLVIDPGKENEIVWDTCLGTEVIAHKGCKDEKCSCEDKDHECKCTSQQYYFKIEAKCVVPEKVGPGSHTLQAKPEFYESSVKLMPSQVGMLIMPKILDIVKALPVILIGLFLIAL